MITDRVLQQSHAEGARSERAPASKATATILADTGRGAPRRTQDEVVTGLALDRPSSSGGRGRSRPLGRRDWTVCNGRATDSRSRCTLSVRV